jgi:hypothetical protein
MTAMRSKTELRQQATLAKKKLAQLRDLRGNLRPQEPYGKGSVIRFTIHGRYSCAAIRVQDGVLGYWYVTQGGVSVPPKTWESLLDWIGEGNCATIEVLS